MTRPKTPKPARQAKATKTKATKAKATRAPKPKPKPEKEPPAPARAGPGRPSDYCRALGDYILGEMCEGRTVASICAARVVEIETEKGPIALHLPSARTVRRWALHNEEFRPLYARAREMQAHAFFEGTIDIADDGRNDFFEVQTESGLAIRKVDHDHIQRSRLRVDTRKWAAEKLLPREYGQRVNVDLHTDPLDDMDDRQLAAHAATLIGQLARLGVAIPAFGAGSGGGGPGGGEGIGAHAGEDPSQGEP